MTNDAEYLFLCLLAIFGKMSVQGFCLVKSQIISQIENRECFSAMAALENSATSPYMTPKKMSSLFFYFFIFILLKVLCTQLI